MTFMDWSPSRSIIIIEGCGLKVFPNAYLCMKKKKKKFDFHLMGGIFSKIHIVQILVVMESGKCKISIITTKFGCNSNLGEC